MSRSAGSKYLLGFDIGGVGLKSCIFTEEGALVGFGRASNTIRSSKPGWAELSPDELWEGFLKTLHEASHQARISTEQIGSIGISTTCPALIPLGRKGEPLRNAIMNFDQRSAEQAERLSGLVGENRIFEITGNRLASGAISVTSMVWIKENERDVYQSTNCFGYTTTFFVHKLTDQFVLDWTNASLTGLFETGKGLCWSDELLDRFGIPPEKLPLIMQPTKVAGGVTERAAKETGLRVGTPVSAGAADTACSALGLGITGPGQMFISSGTSEIVTFSWDRYYFDRRFLNRIYVEPGLWLSHGAMNTAGASVRWFSDNFCPEGLSRVGGKGINSYEAVVDFARKSKPGANGVIFLPYLQGERTPLWDPDARGAFLGMSLSTTREDMTRAVLEGTAYALRQIVEIAEEVTGNKVSEIQMTGGGTKNVLWQQIKSDVLGKRLMAATFPETAVLGAAMLGGIAAGIYEDYREAVSRAVATGVDITEPDKENFQIYSRYYDIFTGLYPVFKDQYKKMAVIDRFTSLSGCEKARGWHAESAQENRIKLQRTSC
jgi:xylulokinase